MLRPQPLKATMVCDLLEFYVVESLDALLRYLGNTSEHTANEKKETARTRNGKGKARA